MYFRTNIPFGAWQALNQAFNGFLRNYMLEKPEFDGISTKDKNTLVDNNSALVGNVAMSVGTVFENYPKCRIRLFSILAFSTNFLSY